MFFAAFCVLLVYNGLLATVLAQAVEVSTGKELQNAIRDNARAVIITDHLDVRGLKPQRDATFSTGSTFLIESDIYIRVCSVQVRVCPVMPTPAPGTYTNLPDEPHMRAPHPAFLPRLSSSVRICAPLSVSVSQGENDTGMAPPRKAKAQHCLVNVAGHKFTPSGRP